MIFLGKKTYSTLWNILFMSVFLLIIAIMFSFLCVLT